MSETPKPNPEQNAPSPEQQAVTDLIATAAGVLDAQEAELQTLENGIQMRHIEGSGLDSSFRLTELTIDGKKHYQYTTPFRQQHDRGLFIYRWQEGDDTVNGISQMEVAGEQHKVIDKAQVIKDVVQSGVEHLPAQLAESAEYARHHLPERSAQQQQVSEALVDPETTSTPEARLRDFASYIESRRAEQHQDGYSAEEAFFGSTLDGTAVSIDLVIKDDDPKDVSQIVRYGDVREIGPNGEGLSEETFRREDLIITKKGEMSIGLGTEGAIIFPSYKAGDKGVNPRFYKGENDKYGSEIIPMRYDFYTASESEPMTAEEEARLTDKTSEAVQILMEKRFKTELPGHDQEGPFNQAKRHLFFEGTSGRVDITEYFDQTHQRKVYHIVAANVPDDRGRMTRYDWRLWPSAEAGSQPLPGVSSRQHLDLDSGQWTDPAKMSDKDHHFLWHTVVENLKHADIGHSPKRQKK